MNVQTVLVYLNDVHDTDGGETVFPVANASAGIQSAAGELAKAGVHHTFDKCDDKPRLAAATKIVNAQAEKVAKGDGGIKVAPQRGAACVFYTMGPSGAIDGASFHFGASVMAPCAGKWTLQFFKEIPTQYRGSVSSRATYAQKVHPLAGVVAASGPVECS